MLKKVVFGVVAGSLVLAAQAALADSQQFLINGKWQGVADLPFATHAVEAATGRNPAPTNVERRASPTMGDASSVKFPAPYDMGGGYFN